MRPRERAVFALAAGLFALHLAMAGRYGIFRDEMYYVACGRHLAFGYVDHPPLVALLARASQLFGHSLYALRLFPAILSAATVVLTAELARSFGGGRFAQLLAAVCVVAAPEFLGTFHVLSMNAALPPLWCASAIFVVRALTCARPRAWIGFGVACGVALLAKHSTLFFGVGLAVGILATPHRRAFLTRGPWIGAGLALLILAPNIAWETLHGWPTLEFMHNAQTKKMVAMSPGSFVVAQLVDMLPLTAPVWIGGTGWLLFAERARPYRFLGIAFLVTFAVVLVGRGKPYYLAPAFPIVFAAGGAAFEAWLRRVWARVLAVALVAAGAVPIAPFALPILEEPTFVRYAASLGVSESSDEKHEKGALPQFFADQHGWQTMVEKVARAYAALPPEEQRVAAIRGDNYGEAGAVDYFGPALGLPPAVSGHNAYFMWGPPKDGRGELLIVVGEKREWVEQDYEDVRQVDETDDGWAMPYENHVPIFVARKPKRPISVAWPELKHFI